LSQNEALSGAFFLAFCWVVHVSRGGCVIFPI